MTQAPETPTTAELQQKYPIDQSTIDAISNMRNLISNALLNPDSHTLGLVGYCARPSIENSSVIIDESNMVAELHDPENGLVAVHRGPMWKPRTNPEDWHGEETTDPEGAYQTMVAEAELNANVAVEIGKDYHLSRYGQLLVVGWTGGRSIDNDELIEHAATWDPSLPLLIKNGLDGDIEKALKQVERATSLRGADDAPVALLYRGGTKADTPKKWEEAQKLAHQKTGGKFVSDTAHGGEMAYDPEGKYKKSVDGQVLAMYALKRLARLGYAPAGVMIEASELESPTDPHMPIDLALTGLKEVHEIKKHNNINRVSKLSYVY